MIFKAFDLHLFDAEESGTVSAFDPVAAANAAADAVMGASPTGDSTGNLSGTPANAQQGGELFVEAEEESQAAKSDSDTHTDQEQEPRETRQEAYERAKKEYKDLFQQDFQSALNRRLKSAKAKEAEQARVIDRLNRRYGTDSLEALDKAIAADKSYVSAAAEEAGMTESQYEYFEKMKAEKAELSRQLDDYKSEEQNRKTAQELYSQEQAMQKKVPGFSLADEMENEEFYSALSATGSVEKAYKMAHYDEAVVAAQKAAEKRVLDNVRANGKRPAENGARPSGGALRITKDIKNLSLKDFEEINKRARSGEKFTFN